MNLDNHQEKAPEQSVRWWSRLVAWGTVLIVMYFLLTQHFDHVIQALPYLLLLACPLMHLFMHHGHGAHRNEREVKTRE